MYDIIIKKGKVFNGSDSKPEIIDIGIKKDEIVTLGNLSGYKAKTEINAEGLFVSPGFIEINTIADRDLSVLYNRNAENFVRQGVTTVIGGACGASLAPFLKKSLESVYKWGDYKSLNVNWHSVREFLHYLSLKRTAVNIGFLLSWAILRNNFTKQQFRGLKKEEKKELKRLIEDSLKDGVFGVAFGYGFDDEKAVSIDEILELTPVIKKYKGYIAFNLRDESVNFLSSLEEIAEVVQKSELSGEIYQLKTLREPKNEILEKGLQLLQDINKEKELLNFDLMPYETLAVLAYSLLPDWAAVGGRKVLLHNLRNETTKGKIIADMKERKILSPDITVAKSGDYWWFAGKTLQEISHNFQMDIENTFLKLIEISEGNITLLIKTFSSEELKKIISSPFSFISSSSGFTTIDNVSKNWEHPAAFGTFPKFLREFVREKKVFSWEQAIHKLTGKVANKIGLKNRGFIKNGYKADIVIFDPEKITDESTFQNPYQYPSGIRAVIINGKLAFHKGRTTSQLSGNILRRSIS